jgi:hypothetical protein
MKAMAALVLIIAIGFHPPCKAQQRRPGADSTPPTATEVFHLRSECADLGHKIMNDNIAGPGTHQTELSRYDPKSNRCYVEMTVETADQMKLPHLIDRYLYDGQTGEMLAALHNQGDEHKSGIVFGSHHEAATYANGYYDDTRAYIDALMSEGRRN